MIFVQPEFEHNLQPSSLSDAVLAEEAILDSAG